MKVDGEEEHVQLEVLAVVGRVLHYHRHHHPRKLPCPQTKQLSLPSVVVKELLTSYDWVQGGLTAVLCPAQWNVRGSLA